MNQLTSYFLLLFTTLSLTLSAQQFNHSEIPHFVDTDMRIIKVEPIDSGLRLFIMAKEYVTNSGAQEAVYINKIWIMEQKSNGRYVISDQIVLSQPALNSYRPIDMMRRNKFEVGLGSTIKNYEEITEQYPALKEIDVLDDHNGIFPESYYKSKLSYSAFKGKVLGFNSKKISKNASEKAAPKKKKGRKKGLLSKVAQVGTDLNKFNSKLNGEDLSNTFEVVEEVNLDWEKIYNGGQDKKNYWAVIESAASPLTGNVLAINSYKSKDDNLTEFQQQEIVLIDNQGEVINRTERNLDIPWEKEIGANHYTKNENNLADINYSTQLFKQKVTKKINAEGNKNQLNLLGINADGSVLYDHIYDLPKEFRTLDTLITSDHQTTIAIGTMEKWFHKFVLVSSPSSQKMYAFDVDKKMNIVPHSYNSTQQGEFIVFKNYKSTTKSYNAYYLHPLNDADFNNPIVIDNIDSDNKGSNFELIIDDADNTIAVTKELTKVKNYRGEVTLPTFYRIANGKAEQISNFENNPMYLERLMYEQKTKIYKHKGQYYFVNKLLTQDEDGELSHPNVLTSMTF